KESVAAFFTDCCQEQEMQRLLQQAAQEVAALYKKTASILPQNASDDSRRNARQFALGLAQRFLFSALVDADWTDTASFMNAAPPPPALDDKERQAIWDRLCAKMESFARNEIKA